MGRKNGVRFGPAGVYADRISSGAPPGGISKYARSDPQTKRRLRRRYRSPGKLRVQCSGHLNERRAVDNRPFVSAFRAIRTYYDDSQSRRLPLLALENQSRRRLDMVARVEPTGVMIRGGEGAIFYIRSTILIVFDTSVKRIDLINAARSTAIFRYPIQWRTSGVGVGGKRNFPSGKFSAIINYLRGGVQE